MSFYCLIFFPPPRLVKSFNVILCWSELLSNLCMCVCVCLSRGPGGLYLSI